MTRLQNINRVHQLKQVQIVYIYQSTKRFVQIFKTAHFRIQIDKFYPIHIVFIFQIYISRIFSRDVQKHEFLYQEIHMLNIIICQG